jgi:predicted metalloendopeptidase
MHLEIRIYCDFKNKEEKIHTHKWNSWFEVMPKILDKEIKQSKFWVTRMKYFHKYRRPSRRIVYSAENYLKEVNQIGKHEDIEIVRCMKEWNTINCINVLRVLNANITNNTLFEAYIKTPIYKNIMSKSQNSWNLSKLTIFHVNPHLQKIPKKED